MQEDYKIARILIIAAAASGLLAGGCSNSGRNSETARSSNQPPQAFDDTVVQNGGTQAILVLGNDRDPDGDVLAIKSMGAPAAGAVAVNDNGTPGNAGDDYLDYTPAAGYDDLDSFTYTISDPAGLTASATVHIRAMDTAPVASYDSTNTAPDTPVSIFVLANDTDPRGLPLQLLSVSAPANGTAAINDNGTAPDATDDFVDYLPTTGFIGTDSFSYTVSNGNETVSAFVNVIVGGAGSTAVRGDVTKGPIAAAVIRLFRIDGAGLPTGNPVAQTITDAQGKWLASVPLPREPLLVVALGGRYHDETDSGPDPDQRRVIQLDPTDQLEGVLPSANDYLALNLYTNALLLKARAETTANEFGQVYANNRSLMTQAMGFDPLTTAPTDPGNPDAGATEAARQYALVLGGAANVANAVIQAQGQDTVTFNVLHAFVEDMQDCRLDGVNQDGPVQFNVLGVQRYMPTSLDLNLQITRFRNNNFSLYAGTTAYLDQTVCSQSGAAPDTSAPVITLLGANPLTLEGGAIYTEPGATAADDRNGDLTGSIVITGDVDALVVGNYTLTYTSSDSAGNTATATRQVNVVDTTAPLMTLNGSNPVTVLVNTAYGDAGATAMDLVDGDLTAAIATVNPVDVTTPGTYTVTYDVTDNAGNPAVTLTRTVAVIATTNPVIMVNGNNPMTVEAGSAYVDPGATAVDFPDGDLTASIVAVSNVNTAATGFYSVTYDVVDSGANPAVQQVRVVNVIDSTAPSIALSGANPQLIEAPAAYVELGATASDSFEGNLSAGIVIDASAVNTAVPGSYLVTYDVTDSAGNAAATVTRTVTAQDTTAPVIVLTGFNPQSLAVDTPYVELAASASDSLDGDLSASVVIDTTGVDPTTPGTYSVTYNVTDAAGNAAAQQVRTINVVASAVPVIALAGANPQIIEAGSAYVELGAAASDTEDGDLTAAIVVNATAVDTMTPGSYVVTYDVTDSGGNPAVQATRTVTVQDTTAPVIALAGAASVSHEAGTPYVDAGATASDSLDGNITPGIVTGGAVNINAPGVYLLTYDVSDAAGNAAAQVTRTVTVVDTIAPVIALLSTDPLAHEAGTVFSDPGATAIDSFEGNISGSLVTGGTVNVNAIGDYVLTYDVSDGSGNAATQVTRTVQLRDSLAPVIALVSSDPLAHEAGTAFTDPGATANDNFEGDISGSIVTGGTVDVNVAGDYVLTYDVSDGSGNVATQVTRTVTVADTIAPVITLVSSDPLAHEVGTPFSDPGATANDSFDGDLSGSIVSGGTVDANVIGDYVLTYDISDRSGNAATQVTRTVQVRDTQAPVIALVGSDPLAHEAGTAFSDPGATASDSFEGDISGSIVTGGTVNVNAVGDYVLTYNVSDGSGNAASQVTRTVQVRDTTAPAIALVGSSLLAHEAGTAFSDPGATASDSFEGDISGSIVPGGAVNVNAVGDYVLTYDVSDGSGNAATRVTRTVQVRDTLAPVIALAGADPLAHEAGTAFSDPGATASDSFEGDISGSIVPGGAVNVNAVGDYVLTYDVSDGSGNAAIQVTRTVQVRDTTAPVIAVVGSDPLAHEAGTAFSDPGATANDSFEGDLSGSIVPGGAVNVNAVGDYVLTYDVSDGSGNAATQVTRTVQVRDTTAPVIALLGANPDVVAQGSGPYADPGATANDAFEGDLTGAILVTGSVDTTTIGTYVLAYDVSDSSANATATVARTVEVVPPAQALDSDGDGLSDAIELVITGSATATQANTFFIDPDPSITVRDGTSWATAYAGIEDVVAANAGFVPQGLSAAQPTYLVLGDTSGWPATPGNPDLYQITVANGTCSHIAVIGSMASGRIHPATGLTEPNTILNAPNARVLLGNNCSNLQFHQVQIVDSGGPAVADGGAVRLSTGYAIFDTVYFRRNQATSEGGALRLGNGAGTTVIRNSIFEDNAVTGAAGLGGGAILLDNVADADISDTIFLGNSALRNGGAIYGVQNASLQISGSHFAGNQAGLDGGALYMMRHNVSPANEIAHTVFSGNRAVREGGAVYHNCNDFSPPLRMFNNLFAGNAAMRGGGLAIDGCDATVYEGNTFIFNEATAASGGGAIHVDTTFLVAPNFRPMPEIDDNVIYANVDAGGISAYSINNLPAWGQNDSHENLIDDALSVTGKDTLMGDPALEFDAAWYLLQASSQAVNLSQVNAANANKFLATPEKTTDRNGAADAAKADVGYHYPGAYAGDVISLSAETSLQGNGGTTGQAMVVALFDGLGVPVGSGYRVSLEIAAGSAPVNVQPVSTAPDPLAPAGAWVATDFGNGRYQLMVDTNGVPGPDSVTVNVYADGVLAGQAVFPVNP